MAAGDPAMEQVACEDLKAFERRMTEIIASSQPGALRWRVVLVVMSVFLAVGAISWLGDPDTAEVPFLQSLGNHPYFTASVAVVLLLFALGAHRRVVAPSILVSRTREVLADFAMDCDETGKLILRPRPATA